MGLNDSASYSKAVIKRQEMATIATQPGVESGKRAFHEGAVAGYDGISAINVPYRNGPLRLRWFDGHTYGRGLRLSAGSNSYGYDGVENDRGKVDGDRGHLDL